MTDDIVTRLRQNRENTIEDWWLLEPMCTEAADEIERLRLILTHICDVWGSDLLSIIEEMNGFKKEIK